MRSPVRQLSGRSDALRPPSWAHGSRVFFDSAFLTAATVLGLGILSMPVKVSNSGLRPFLATFSCALAGQLFVQLFVVELLQRTDVLMRKEAFGGPRVARSQPLVECVSESSEEGLLPCTEGQNASCSRRAASLPEGDAEAASPLATLPPPKRDPDLHTMARFFLPNAVARAVFDGCVYFHFLIIMIAYAISAASAYGEILGVGRSVVIRIFVITLAVLVITMARQLQPLIVWMTVGKATLLVGMIFIVAYLAGEVRIDPASDWGAVGEPFLIGTVSLGGAANVLPVLYGWVPDRSHAVNLRAFRCGCCSGVIACWMLVVTWTFLVLHTVPQHAPPGEASLSVAYSRNDISTVPLLEYIKMKHPNLEWLAMAAHVFMIVTVTVSFIAQGLGLKHYLDGCLAALPAFEVVLTGDADSRSVSPAPAGVQREQQHQAVQLADLVPCSKCPGAVGRAATLGLGSSAVSMKWARMLFYCVSYLGILIIADFYANSLYVVLEVVNSMLLNLETGCFIAAMMWQARLRSPSPRASDRPDDAFIPLRLPYASVAIGVAVVGIYFGSAVLYDVAGVIHRSE